MKGKAAANCFLFTTAFLILYLIFFQIQTPCLLSQEIALRDGFGDPELYARNEVTAADRSPYSQNTSSYFSTSMIASPPASKLMASASFLV